MAFTDNFNRSDELLQASANWTRLAGTNDSLKVASNQLAGNGTLTSVSIYAAPDQGSPDMYAEADLLQSGANDWLVIRAVDLGNHLGIHEGAGSMLLCRSRVGGTSVTLGSTSVTGVTRVRIEAEGTTVRFYADTGSGLTLFHEETGFTDLASATRAGFRSSALTGTGDGTALWDNFETGVLSVNTSILVPTGPTR